MGSSHTINENPLNMPKNPLKNIEQDDGIQFQRKNISTIIRNGQLRSQQYYTTSSAQYKVYALSLNMALNENNKGAREILSILDSMVEQSDRPRFNEVRQKYFETKQYVVLKCFLFLLTSRSYPNIHGVMTKSSYSNLIKVIARVRDELYEYNKKTNNSLKINLDSKQTCFLYRGIKQPDNKMVMGDRLYWRSFASTSKRKKIAEKFGPYRYTIQLKVKGHHPHIVVPKEFSEYPDEEEVILFPYFYFEVKHISKYEGGQQYIIQQIQKP